MDRSTAPPDEGSLAEDRVEGQDITLDQVRDALEHLYDLAYLHDHPLAPADDGGVESAGQRLRRRLAAAIEALNPGPGTPFRAPQARPFNVLSLHYLEGMTVQEAAYRLGISRRQAHRDLRGAIEQVATVLMATVPAEAAPEGRVRQLSSVQAELARVTPRPSRVSLAELVANASSTVTPLARRRGVELRMIPPEEPVVISTDPELAEQIVVSVLSSAVGQAVPGTLTFAVVVRDGQATVTLQYYLDEDTGQPPAIGMVHAQLADRIGWRVGWADQAHGPRTVSLVAGRRGPTVLVVDDNEGLVDLLDRYLTDQTCRVVAASDGVEATRLALEVVPDAIVLDIMLPQMHGWDVLQRLRTHPKTADIPVVVCSVIGDPDLAYSLGASLVLAKPISREEVLGALRELGIEW